MGYKERVKVAAQMKSRITTNKDPKSNNALIDAELNESGLKKIEENNCLTVW